MRSVDIGTSSISTEGRTIVARVTTLGQVEKVRDGAGPEYTEELSATSLDRSLRENPEVPVYVVHGHMRGDLAVGTARVRMDGTDVIAEIYIVRSKRAVTTYSRKRVPDASQPCPQGSR